MCDIFNKILSMKKKTNFEPQPIFLTVNIYLIMKYI